MKYTLDVETYTKVRKGKEGDHFEDLKSYTTEEIDGASQAIRVAREIQIQGYRNGRITSIIRRDRKGRGRAL